MFVFSTQLFLSHLRVLHILRSSFQGAQMSFISSGRNSSTPSILKKPGRPRSFPAHSVKFQLDCSLKTLLESYVNEKNRDGYVELIHKIRDSGEKLSVSIDSR